MTSHIHMLQESPNIPSKCLPWQQHQLGKGERNGHSDQEDPAQTVRGLQGSEQRQISPGIQFQVQAR
jgi:hypothetical protein